MIFSRNNQLIRNVIWTIAIAFVMSLFFISGNFLWEMQRSSEKDSDKGTNASAPNEIPQKDRGVVLARTANWNVTAGDYFSELRRLDRRVRARYSNKRGREDFLDILLDRRLLTDSATEMNISPTDEEINQFVADELSKQTGRSITVDQVRSFFSSGVLNKKDFFQQYSIQKLQEKISSPVNYEDSKLKEYYDNHKSQFKDGNKQMSFEEAREKVVARVYYEDHKTRWQNPDRLKIRHILLAPESSKRREYAAKGILPEDVRNLWEDSKNKYKTPLMLEARQILILKDSSKIEAEIDKSEEKLNAYFEENSSKYLAPPRAKISQILLEPDSERWSKKATPTPEEIADYYHQNEDTYNVEKEVKASHVLVESKEKADSIRQEILNGRNFADAAKEYSSCPSSSDGGDLGFFTYGSMVEPFSKTAFNQAVGKISEPVKTNFGWHIVKTTEVKKGGLKKLAEVRSEIVAKLKNEKAMRAAREHAEDLRKQILDGADFAKLAARESDAKSRVSGGEVGWIYQGPPPSGTDVAFLNGEVATEGLVDWRIQRDVFELEPGRVSEPIETDLGIHLVLMLEKEGNRQLTYKEARESVEKDYLEQASETAGIALAEKIRDRILTEKNFSNIVAAMSEGDSAARDGYLGWFTKGEQPEDIDTTMIDGEIANGKFLNTEVEKALFNDNLKVYEPTVVKSSIGYHVIELTNKKPAQIKQFEDVRRDVRDSLTAERSDKLCSSVGEKLLSDLMSGRVEFEDIARENSDGESASRGGDMGWIPRDGNIAESAENKSWLESEMGSEGFSYNAGSFTMGFNLEEELKNVLKDATEGIIPSLIKTKYGYHIVAVEDIQEGTFKPFDDLEEDITSITRMKPSDDEILNYWTDHLDDYRVEARVNIRHIFIEPDGSAADKDTDFENARRKAEDLRKLVVDGTKTFREVASENNSDFTKDNEGELGWKTRDELATAIAEAAFTLEIDEVSPVIKTPFGCHIIRVEEKEEERVKTVEEVKDSIETILLAPLKNQVFDEYITEIRREAGIAKEIKNIDALIMKYN